VALLSACDFTIDAGGDSGTPLPDGGSNGGGSNGGGSNGGGSNGGGSNGGGSNGGGSNGGGSNGGGSNGGGSNGGGSNGGGSAGGGSTGGGSSAGDGGIAIRNHIYGCGGQGLGIDMTEAGEFDFERLVPTAYPFTVTKVRYMLYASPSFAACDDSLAHDVLIFKANTRTPPATPANPVRIQVPSTPSQQQSRWLEVTLPTPLTAQAGEVFYVGVSFSYSSARNICTAFCAGDENSTESSFWSNAAQAPFSPNSMYFDNSPGNQILEVVGGCTGPTCTPSCLPEEDRFVCERNGGNCGVLSGVDNCGAPRTVTCGTCSGADMCKLNVCAGTTWKHMQPTVRPAESYGARITSGPNGTLLMAYTTQGFATPMLATYDGQLWTHERIEERAAVTSADAVADTSGAVHAVYITQATIGTWPGITKTIRYAVRRAGIWSYEDISTDVSINYVAPIAVDAAGNPHVLFTGNNLVSLNHAWRTSTGWQTEMVPINGVITSSALAVGPSGDLHLVYDDYNAGPQDVRYGYKATGATSWQLQTLPGKGLGANVVTDAAGKVYVAYVQRGTGSVDTLTLATGTPSAGSVTLNTEVIDAAAHYEDNGVTPENRVGLAVNAAGTVMVAAKSSSGSNDRVVFWQRQGGVWSSSVVDQDPMGNTGVVEWMGKAYVAYHQDLSATGGFQLFLKLAEHL
jgi:hypothetical protein